jgi:hypothetical protein
LVRARQLASVAQLVRARQLASVAQLVRARQLASVAQLVRALHRNRPARDLYCSFIFRSFSWLGLINVYKFPLDNFIYKILQLLFNRVRCQQNLDVFI